jgi:hypothetical protein
VAVEFVGGGLDLREVAQGGEEKHGWGLWGRPGAVVDFGVALC